jgi:membrane protease YdiL (CAAX protease family)
MKNFVKKYPAVSMVVLSYAIGIGISILVINGVLPESMFFLAATSGSIAGITLTAIVAGKIGLRDLFGRIKIWRVSGRWWAFALFATLGVVICGKIINAILGLDPLDFSNIPQGLVMVVPIFLMQIITAGLGEELGWRGFLLPRMQGRYNALVAGLIVGVLHGFWHTPMFFVEGLSPYQDMKELMGLIPATIGYSLFFVASWSILFTCLLNNTKGSLLLIFVCHASQAWWLSLWSYNNPESIFGLPIAMTIVAIVVVLIYGPKNLSKTNERFVIED